MEDRRIDGASSCKAEATQGATLRSLHQVATLAAIRTRQPRKVTDFCFNRLLYNMLAGTLPWGSEDSDDGVLLLYAVGNKREGVPRKHSV